MIGAVLGRGRRRGAGWRVGAAASMLAASTVVSVIAAGSGVASAAPSDLDTSFGGTGIVQYVTPTAASATGVAVVPQSLPGAGDIVVADGGGAGGQFEVARFTPSGSIDTTFGSGGVYDGFSGEAYGVTVVPAGVNGAGNVVAVGEDASSAAICGGMQPVVAVITPAGATSMTDLPCAAGFFGGGLNAVTIDGTGNIVVAGQISSPTATVETMVARLTTSGTVDVDTATEIGTSNSTASGVGVSASGNDIYTTGYSSHLNGSPPTTTEYLTVADFSTTTGMLNPSFGASGVLAQTPNGYGDALAVMPHGNIVVAGRTLNASSTFQSFLAQYTSSGASTGFNALSLGGTSEFGGVAYQPEGSVLVAAGWVQSGSTQKMVVGQYDSVTGAPNSLFGAGSAVTITSTAAPQGSLAAVAVQSDGKAVAAGDAPVVGNAPAIGLVRVQVPAPRPYSPITPSRVCDTRPGNATQCNGRTIAANTPLTVRIAGRVGVPASATAVVVNVTTVNPAGPGFLSIYPAGSPVPTASNLNVTTAGQVVANLAEVALSGGNIAIDSSVNTDVVVDVEGYTAPAAAGGPGAGLYDPLPSPTRICDTRNAGSPVPGTAAQCNGKTIPANGTLAVQVGGAFGVPVDATAVVANLTTVNSTAAGFLTAFPDGSTLPNASNLNFSAGQVIPNRVIVPMTNGSIDLHSTARTDVIFDISGYFTPTGATVGAGYVALPAPERICDTRAGQSGVLSAQCTGKSIGPGGTLNVLVGSPIFSVPSTATAAVANVTAVNPTVSTFLTVYPGGTPRPSSSDLNPPRGGVEPNLVVATLPMAGSGRINISNTSGRVDVIVDLAGYYTAPGAGS